MYSEQWAVLVFTLVSRVGGITQVRHREDTVCWSAEVYSGTHLCSDCDGDCLQGGAGGLAGGLDGRAGEHDGGGHEITEGWVGV